MEDELLSFPRTEEVLKQLAEDVMAGYKENLIRDGHFTYYGKDRLVDTMTTKVTVDGMSFTASLQLNKYWEYLEEGTGPARGRSKYWPDSSAIAKWVEIKPVIPRPDGNGRIPTPKQLTFLISRKIHEYGTEGSHGLQKTKDAIIPFYMDKLEKAINEDVGFYVMRVFRANAEF